MAPSSLFGSANFAPQSAMEILKSSKRLPVARAFGQVSLDSLAWGIGSANWQQASYPVAPSVAMKKELRTLVAASFDVFMRLQRLHDGKTRTGRELVAEEIVRASREYREALKSCVFSLEDRGRDADDELLDLMKVSLAIWHLLELLFLQRRARDDSALAYDLAAWLHEHYGSAKMEELDTETQRLRALGSSQAVEEDAKFWSTIYSLVATGCGAQAWSVLSQHSLFRSTFARDAAAASAASTRETFQTIQRLLLCMPGLQSHQQIEWKKWRDACQYLLNTDTFVRGKSEFKKLLELMTADSLALQEVSTTWYELMMSRLVLEEPKAIAHRFEFLMANCFKAFHGENAQDTMNNFDCIILAILEYDVQSAVQDIHALGFHWMSAHLTDLLGKSNVIAGDEVVEQYGCDMQEYFVLQYAMELSLCKNTWQFTTGYFEKCPVFGATARRSSINSEPIKTDAKAERLWSYCSGKKSLQHTQQQVSLRRALECKEDRAFASALQWALRGSHLDETDRIGDIVLDECEQSGSLTTLFEAVEFLESHPELALTKNLKWLVTYRELQLVLEDRVALQLQLKEAHPVGSDEHEQIRAQLQFVSKQAASRLQDLITSTLAPRRLRSTLLSHAESLLLESPAVLSSEQVFSVMEFIQSIDRSFDRHDFDKNPANLKLKKHVQALLSRNLSAAVLSEGGKGSFVRAQQSSRSHAAPTRSFASLTGNLQLLSDPVASNGLVDFMEDESME